MQDQRASELAFALASSKPISTENGQVVLDISS
jgi:hypothetical protein